MKHHYFSWVTVATIGLFAFNGILTPCMASEAKNQSAQGHESVRPLALPGSPVRRAVLDALRQEMKHLHGMEVIFVVRYMKVKDGWAWVHTLPQSPDGKNHYEDISALLHLKSGTWEVVELACTEEENPQCLSNPVYFSELKKRFPKVPGEILPMDDTRMYNHH